MTVFTQNDIHNDLLFETTLEMCFGFSVYRRSNITFIRKMT